MRVLLTRPEDDSRRIASMLPGGTSAVIYPFTEIVAIDSALDVPSDCDALVFTSSNGARVFASLEPRRDLPVFTVGDRTADVCRAAGFEQVCSASGSLPDLARLLRDMGVRSVFHPHGREVSGDLARMLVDVVGVNEIALYAARECRIDSADLCRRLDEEIDLVTIWSRRNAAILARHLRAGFSGQRIASDLLAISENAAEPLERLPFRRTNVASTPSATGMLDAISANLAALRQ